MTPFNDAIQIINGITEWILETSIMVSAGTSIDVLQLLLFTIIAGAIIYAMANKEA